MRKAAKIGLSYRFSTDGSIPRSLLRGWLPPGVIGAKPLSVIPRSLLRGAFIINGEHIAMSPDDALNTFFNSGLEHLFMSAYHITK